MIEDTITVQKLLTRWLISHGCEVKCADNGLIGLNYLKSESFDVVLTDFVMVNIFYFKFIYFN